jgi:hypothetical protein
VPAVILTVLIIAAAVTTVLVLRSGIAGPAPKPTAGQVNELNWSVFTDEGIAYIDRTRLPRIDLSEPPVQAEPLGLPSDGELTVGPLDSGDVQLDYRLILNGGGEYPGGMQLVVTQFTLTTADGQLQSIVAPVRQVLNFRQTLDALLKRADDLGWQIDTDAIFAQVEQATRAGEPYEFTVGPSDRVGFDVSATASCDPSGFCALTYTVTPAVR